MGGRRGAWEAGKNRRIESSESSSNGDLQDEDDSDDEFCTVKDDCEERAISVAMS